MSAADWAGFILAVLSSLALLFGALRWVIKGYLSELKPNGGTSLNDKIKLEMLPLLEGLRDDLTEIKIKQSKIEATLDAHIQQHKD